MASLRDIPFVDLRDSSPLIYALDQTDTIKTLRDETLSVLPGPAHAVIWTLDIMARRWLQKSDSPYRHEIDQIAKALGLPGVYFLNTSYEWGCTVLVHPDPQATGARLLRTLDWPFHGLGRAIEVFHQKGPAGSFYNLSWPGGAMTLTAMAPGRFAAALNQAPMRRHTGSKIMDYTLGVIRFLKTRFMPPLHLLRYVFENTATFDEARARLETTPIAKPCLYSLTGITPDQCCVIERTETGHKTWTGPRGVANSWQQEQKGWQPRGCGSQDPHQNNRDRVKAIEALQHRLSKDMDWVSPPILNPFTRLAVEMNAATGTLQVKGFEQIQKDKLPQQATTHFSL